MIAARNNYIKITVFPWLEEVKCQDSDLVLTIFECLCEDFIYEKFECEIEEVERMIRTYELNEVGDFKDMICEYEKLRFNVVFN